MFEHCKFSLGMTYIFLYATGTAIIHGFIPDLFTDSTSNSVNYISKRLNESGCRKG